MLTLRRLAVIPTLRCTLRCRMCCNSVPLYDNPPFLPVNEVIADTMAAFDLADRIEWIQLVGGEIFLYPELAALIDAIAGRREQFDRLVLMTNGTLLPPPGAAEALARLAPACEVQISDYGPLSRRVRELEALLAGYGVPSQTKVFHGDLQHYGGWVDNTSYADRGWSEDERRALFDSCWQIKMRNYHMYEGKLHPCIRSLFGLDLGKIPVPAEEYVDVRDLSRSREEKRESLARLADRPLTACRYCGGFDTLRAKRFPAAEQMPICSELRSCAERRASCSGQSPCADQVPICSGQSPCAERHTECAERLP